MNVSNPYECLTIYRPGHGYTGYLKGKIAGQWGEDQFEEMLEWERQYIPKRESDPSKAPGKYDPNDTFERRELTKPQLNELAARLARKYDPCNMTQEEYDSFLDDLVEEGILSRNQLGQLGYHGMVVLGCSLEDLTSWGGSCSYSKDIMTIHNDPFYQRYGYIRSLSDAKGNALAYATMMSWLYPGSGSASFLDYIEKQQSNYAAMTAVLQAMQRQR